MSDPVEEQRENNVGGITGKGFMPGQSGNPGGRPSGRTLTSIIREVLDSKTIKGKPLPEGRTVADVLAEVFIAEALKGKFPFAKEVIDRADGKVPDRHEVETGNGFIDHLCTSLKASYGKANGKADDPVVSANGNGHPHDG
jgi:hypothetical protein